MYINFYLGLPSLQLMSVFFLHFISVGSVQFSYTKEPISLLKFEFVTNLSAVQLEMHLKYFGFQNSLMNCLNLWGFKNQTQQ